MNVSLTTVEMNSLSVSNERNANEITPLGVHQVVFKNGAVVTIPNSAIEFVALDSSHTQTQPRLVRVYPGGRKSVISFSVPRMEHDVLNADDVVGVFRISDS